MQGSFRQICFFLIGCIARAAENTVQNISIINGTKEPVYIVMFHAHKSVFFNNWNTQMLPYYAILIDSKTKPPTYILELRPNAEDLFTACRTDTVHFVLKDTFCSRQTDIRIFKKTNLTTIPTEFQFNLAQLASYAIMPSFQQVRLLVTNDSGINGLEIAYIK